MQQYIGGEFAQNDSEVFKTANSIASIFFPFRVGTFKRFFFETASDGIAAILLSKVRNEIFYLNVPENFCNETLLIIKEKVAPKQVEIFYYNDVTEITPRQNEDNFLIVMHFNSVKNNVLIKYPQLLEKFIVIEDFVQRPFHIKEYSGHYAINSLRKVIPLEVAVLYGLVGDTKWAINPSEYYLLKKKAGALKSEFRQSRIEAIERAYLSCFKNAATAMHCSSIYVAQNAEVEFLSQVNFVDLLQKRKANYSYLKILISDIQDLEILPGDYMFLMVKTSEQKRLRTYLMGEHIFTAIHWADSNSEISKNMLSIPIDQRYGNEDMDRIAFYIRQFFCK